MAAADNGAQVHTISSSLQVQRTSATSEATKIDRQKAEQITTLIAALSLQYYREGVDPAAAKVIYGAFVEDLGDYAMIDIETGIRECRRDPKQKFFPTSGQLRERVQKAAEERIKTQRARTGPRTASNRPAFWWLLPWRDPSWRDEEIPIEHRSQYERTKDARGQ